MEGSLKQKEVVVFNISQYHRAVLGHEAPDKGMQT